MENHRVHMAASEVGRIAKAAEVKKVILTHLPQVGDLELLKAQAVNEAPKTEIIVAEKDLTIEI